MNADEMKRRAAREAANLVASDMVLGLGTGSTAAHFVKIIGEKVRAGLQVRGVPTSEETRVLALTSGIEIIEPDEATIIDLAIDGADELDARLTLIKGGGGALLREKIVAHAARKFVIIADASKKVATLGAFPLPVEIEKAAFALTVRAMRAALASAGYANGDISLRGAKQGGAFISDGGNYIVDCRLGLIKDAAGLDAALREIPGIIETGLFIGMADEAILCGADGVERITSA